MDTKIAPPSYLDISVLSGGRGEKLSGVHEREVAISLSIEVNPYTVKRRIRWIDDHFAPLLVRPR
jgi:hypothetical protein